MPCPYNRRSAGLLSSYSQSGLPKAAVSEACLRAGSQHKSNDAIMGEKVIHNLAAMNHKICSSHMRARGTNLMESGRAERPAYSRKSSSVSPVFWSGSVLTGSQSNGSSNSRAVLPAEKFPTSASRRQERGPATLLGFRRPYHLTRLRDVAGGRITGIRGWICARSSLGPTKRVAKGRFRPLELCVQKWQL